MPFRVTPMAGSIMPPNVMQAFVTCYAGGKDYAQAAGRCLDALLADGMHPAEILQPISAMQASNWSAHIAETWPDHARALASQADFEASIGQGKVVYGPIAGN